LASTRRYFDRAKGSWEDGETNWYTVSTFRQLAHNTAVSISKGERVVVHGRLRLRAWDNGETSGMAVEIEADAIGHDLTWGTTAFTKVRLARGSTGGDDQADAGEPRAGAMAGATATSAWPGVEESLGGDTATDRPALGEESNVDAYA